MVRASSPGSVLGAGLAVLLLRCAPQVAAGGAVTTPAAAVTEGGPSVSMPGQDLPLHSSGVAEGPGWVLRDNGFVGVFLSVPSAGTVSVRVNASGVDDTSAEPRMRIAIADQVQEVVVRALRFLVGAGS